MNTTKRFWVILVGILAVLPLFPLLVGRFPATGDMRDVFIPLESFFHAEQMKGNIPAWNPAVSFGFPVIASAQIGFFYPILFVLRFLPIYLELPLALVLHTSLCAIGTFLFTRRLGLSKEASLLTALSFSLSQFIWQHLTHLNIFLAVAWFPWQMWAVDILFRKERIERKGIVALIALFGIPFLIGQIQIPFLMMLVALMYGIYLRLTPSNSPFVRGREQRSVPLLTKERLGEVMLRTAVPILAIAVGVFLLACVQLLPTFELATLSSRGTSGGFDIVRANQHSYPIYHLPTFLFPRFYGNDNTYWGKRLEIEYGSYIGVIPLMLAVWYLWMYFLPSYEGRRGGVDPLRTPSRSPLYKGEKSTHRFFICLAGISFLLALGSLSPFRLIGLEPSFWIFSAPARWLLFTTFSLSIFAGLGFDAIWEHLKSARKFFTRSLFIICVGIVVCNIFLFVPALTPSLSPIGERGNAKLQSMLISAKTSSVSLLSPYTYIAIISLLALPYALRNNRGKNILLAVSVLDLALIAYTTTPTLPWKSILTAPATIQALPQNVRNHTARIYSLRDGGDTGAYFTDPSSRANTAIRELQKKLLLPMTSAQFGIYGIEWPASLDLSEQGEQLEKLDPTQPYAIKNTALAQELNIGAVLSPAEDGSVTITPLSAKPRFDINNGTVEVVSEQPSEIMLKTNSTQDSTLTVRDTFYPGWRAYIDGEEAPITKAPLFFRSVEVPAGEHTIRMQYTPKSLYTGGALTAISLLLLIFLRLRK